MGRVLVVRFSSLGDIVLTEPVVAALIEKYPEYSIDYLVLERFAPLVAHFEHRPDEILAFPPAITTRELPAYSRRLASKGYDLVIDLHDSLRSKLLRRAFKGSSLRRYQKPRLNRWLLFYLHLNRFSKDFSVVREYLRYAGLEASAPTAPRMQCAADPIAAVQEAFNLADEYLVCIPGAAWPQKSWLIERYIEVFKSRPTGTRPQVVLLGGEDDVICKAIADGLADGGAVNLRGRTDLEQALAVLAGCRLAVGSDTGLMHAAEALGRPIILILGPTSTETGARCHHPASRRHEARLWCRPCSQNGKRPCYRREQFCLTSITARVVGDSIDTLLGRA